MTSYSLFWLGDTGVVVSILVPVCVPCGGSFCSGMGQLGTLEGETGQAGDTVSGVLQDTPAWGHCFRAQSPCYRDDKGRLGLGVLRGVSVPTPCQPPPAAQGPHGAQGPLAAACPGVHPRNLGARGGPAASVASDPPDDTSPLLFLLSPPAGSA